MRVERDAVAKVLMGQLEDTPSRVALALSGGIDSLSIMFALLRLGREVTAYSFRLDGIQSTDFAEARRWADKTGVNFKPIVLPTEIERLKEDVKILVDQYGLSKKTDIECAWAFLYLLPVVQESVLVTGSASDGHFGISKKAMIHFRHSTEKLDEFRNMTFSNPNYAQQVTIKQLGQIYNVDVKVPYASQPMRDLFMGCSWKELNTPKQKQPIIDSFIPNFKQGKVRQHTNLQLGDSKIAEHFTKLLNTDWNTKRHKSVVGIYNSVVKGEL